jgi:3-isopropylmalate dehydratase small subunit
MLVQPVEEGMVVRHRHPVEGVIGERGEAEVSRAEPRRRFHVVLRNQVITTDDEAPIPFTILAARKEVLLRGEDEIAATLRFRDEIGSFDAA